MSDEATKIIENYETTTASTHDSNVCAELISEDTAEQMTELLADSGYFGEAVSKKVRENIVRSIGLARCKIRHGLVFMLYNMKRCCFLSRTGQLCPDATK